MTAQVGQCVVVTQITHADAHLLSQEGKKSWTDSAKSWTATPRRAWRASKTLLLVPRGPPQLALLQLALLTATITLALLQVQRLAAAMPLVSQLQAQTLTPTASTELAGGNSHTNR